MEGHLMPKSTGCTEATELPPAEEAVAEDVDQECRVYVGHLTPQANETDLQAFFRPFGVIRHIWIARKPPGFAFVTYAKAEAAQRAIQAVQAMENPTLVGQTIKCALSKDAGGSDTEAIKPAKKRTRVRKRPNETFKQKKERKLKAMEEARCRN
ncbi:hypothetical protein AC1031_021488 [Aphanomyces cochlioides]|nr:hypothetical protein AC1031_021488 [Aphanomyces cochlioides]